MSINRRDISLKYIGCIGLRLTSNMLKSFKVAWFAVVSNTMLYIHSENQSFLFLLQGRILFQNINSVWNKNYPFDPFKFNFLNKWNVRVNFGSTVRVLTLCFANTVKECCILRVLGFFLIFQEKMMVQENPIELEKMMTWSRISKLRWNSFLFRWLRVSFSGRVWIGVNSYSMKICF